jgi:ABC-2 type transport system ATP-binding protein
VLEASQLSKSYGERPALRELSLRLVRGRILGLIGPDGAGKTTALRLLAGLMRPDAGQILVSGVDVARRGAALRGLIGYMAQAYSLYGDLSVEENFRFFAAMLGVASREIPAMEERLLGLAMLLEHKKKPAGTLSGGMYKKLALACVLSHKPPLVLLDEPTNGVDPISRRELWAFLRELVDDGTSVVIATPYMDEAERCDEVALLVDGRIVAHDNPTRLMAEHQAGGEKGATFEDVFLALSEASSEKDEKS